MTRILALIFFSVGAAPALAQTVYETGFESADGWTFENSSGSVGWALDATPGGTAFSGSQSLNYNDGSDYADGTGNKGHATSPPLSVGKSENPVLTFQCFYETETTGIAYDRRFLRISNTGFSSLLLEAQLAGEGASTLIGDCAEMGQWHQHTVKLDPSWETIQIRFSFDAVNKYYNAFAGWFVDDLEVKAGSGTPATKYKSVKKWDFDSGLGDWESKGSGGATTWSSDATPSTIAGNVPYVSAPSSLNYNNGKDYATGSAGNNGVATSPEEDIGGLDAPVLRFECLYDTETSGVKWDKRFLRISNNGFSSFVVDAQLAGAGGSSLVGSCPASGVWHTHTVPLDPAWGKIRIRFEFDSVNSKYNNYAGWFLDDVRIQVVDDSPSGGSDDHEGKNGDHTINDTLCGGAVRDVVPWWPIALFPLLAVFGLAAGGRGVRRRPLE